MRRFDVKFIIMAVMLSSFLFLPFSAQNVFSSGGQESHGDAHGDAHSDELPGIVPHDRPLKEVRKDLARMNALNEDVVTVLKTGTG